MDVTNGRDWILRLQSKNYIFLIKSGGVFNNQLG